MKISTALTNLTISGVIANAKPSTLTQMCRYDNDYVELSARALTKGDVYGSTTLLTLVGTRVYNRFGRQSIDKHSE